MDEIEVALDGSRVREVDAIVFTFTSGDDSSSAAVYGDATFRVYALCSVSGNVDIEDTALDIYSVFRLNAVAGGVRYVNDVSWSEKDVAVRSDSVFSVSKDV